MMDANPKTVRNYVTPEGKVPYEEWIYGLKDKRTIARVLKRINRLRLGNFGDCKSVGSGVCELRIHFGPGFRVYYGIVNDQIVILLTAGAKGSQKKDIATAKSYWEDYQTNAN